MPQRLNSRSGADAAHTLARIDALRPTQITVGLREIGEKRLRWRRKLRSIKMCDQALPIVPVVRGPGGAVHLIDRHHFLRAILAEGFEHIRIQQIADLSNVSTDRFWSILDGDGWCHPYDQYGRRRPFTEIPSTIGALVDDPYRSLASALRRAGGYKKSAAPFSEFVWADYLRRRISKDLLAADFDAALAQAWALSREARVHGLPGARLRSAYDSSGGVTDGHVIL